MKCVVFKWEESHLHDLASQELCFYKTLIHKVRQNLLAGDQNWHLLYCALCCCTLEIKYRLEQPWGSALISTLALITRIASPSDCSRVFQSRAYTMCDILWSASAQAKSSLIRVCVRSECCSHLWRSAELSLPWTAPARSQSATLERSSMVFLLVQKIQKVLWNT